MRTTSPNWCAVIGCEIAEIRNVLAPAPHLDLASRLNSAT